jgi:hypothetical protein
MAASMLHAIMVLPYRPPRRVNSPCCHLLHCLICKGSKKGTIQLIRTWLFPKSPVSMLWSRLCLACLNLLSLQILPTFQVDDTAMGRAYTTDLCIVVRAGFGDT